MRLAEADQEARAEGVLGRRERLARELTQDVVQEPGRVELCEEDGEGLAMVALVVLQGVSAVPGGEAEELIDGEFDGGMFEV